PAPRNGRTRSGSDAPPPTPCRSRGGRRGRSGRALPGSSGTRCARPTASGSGARRGGRTSCRRPMRHWAAAAQPARRAGIAEYAVPPSAEPFDFRRQAASYARHRPDYSPALYAAIAERAGEGAGRRAIDLGCGTGFVSRALVARGWRVVGIDFSAPMLAEAHAAVGSQARFARARAEALPLGNAAGALLTCRTAFHWFAPPRP